MSVRVAAAVAALALGVLAGCGPSADNLPRRAPDEGDQRWAEQTGLERADLPRDWTATRPDEKAGQRATGCSSVDYSDLTLTAEANSDSFFDGERLLALAVTQVYASAEDARASLERGSREDAARCIRDSFRNTVTRIDEGFDIAEIQVREADPPEVEANVRRFEIVLDYEVTGGRVPGFFDIYVLQRGRAVVAVFLGGIERFPDDLTERVLDAVAERLRSSPPPG